MNSSRLILSTPMNFSTDPAGIPFVTFTCAKDVHYGKALLGSIRHFYPCSEIHVVLDDDVSRHDDVQIRAFPQVTIHRISHLIARHKINLRGLLAKFNVLFLSGVRRAVVADADSVLVGPVLDAVDPSVVFHALNSKTIDLTSEADAETFSRWAIDLVRLNAAFHLRPTTHCPFVQGSHFFIDVERFPRQILYELLPDMSYTHSPTTLLRAGDQGFWNYLVNFGQQHGVPAAWGSHTIQVGVDQHLPAFDDTTFIASDTQKDRYFIHYVGFRRRYWRRHHEYASALKWATRLYYEAIGNHAFPYDEARRASHLLRRSAIGLGKRFAMNIGLSRPPA